MNCPEKPVKGFKSERVCIKCDSKEMMEIAKFKKKSVNADGSSCYTIQATCPKCNYVNGEWKPMWWNFYELGAMQW